MYEQLVLDNLNLIYYVLKQIGLYSQHEEYYDIGLIGLVRAAKTYDPNKGYKFSTYAAASIRNAVLHELRKLSVDRYKANYHTISLDTVVCETEKKVMTLEDFIQSDYNLEEDVIKREQLSAVKKAIKTLTDREKMIFKYYIIDDMNQLDIAAMLNVSQAQVSRTMKKIIEKIRKQVL